MPVPSSQRYSSAPYISPGQYSLVDHVHDLGVDLLAHALLLRLQFSTLFTSMIEIDTVEIIW